MNRMRQGQGRDGMDGHDHHDFDYYGVHWTDGVAVATNTTTTTRREWASGPPYRAQCIPVFAASQESGPVPVDNYNDLITHSG